jgi:hypothetical protein
VLGTPEPAFLERKTMSVNDATNEGSTGTQTTVREAVEGAVILDDQRPDDCQCLSEYFGDDPLPCWACCREGFEEPNPHVVDEE